VVFLFLRTEKRKKKEEKIDGKVVFFLPVSSVRRCYEGVRKDEKKDIKSPASVAGHLTITIRGLLEPRSLRLQG
jgi:hypothetical protein